MSRSDTCRTRGLRVVVIVNNLLARVFTVIFARVLEPSGYGSLAVLGARFIVMMVPRSALQVAAAIPRLHTMLAGSWTPAVALTLLLMLQELQGSS